jgi:hypothetical protein
MGWPWVGQYIELYSRETTITDDAMNYMEAVKTPHHLNTFTTITEVNCAIDDSSTGRLIARNELILRLL